GAGPARPCRARCRRRSASSPGAARPAERRPTPRRPRRWRRRAPRYRAAPASLVVLPTPRWACVAPGLTMTSADERLAKAAEEGRLGHRRQQAALRAEADGHAPVAAGRRERVAVDDHGDVDVRRAVADDEVEAARE